MIRLVLEIPDKEYVELVDLFNEFSYFAEARRIRLLIESSVVLKEDVINGHVMKRWYRP